MEEENRPEKPNQGKKEAQGWTRGTEFQNE